MDDQDLVRRNLDNDPDAREQFIQKYTDAILRGLLRKCRKNCPNFGCPLRHALTQQNLERTRCDELGNLYVFSLESIFKALRSYQGDEEGLDQWMHRQTDPNGILFRQRFAAYMAAKYPLTGRARIPDRFQKRWSSIQKQVYKAWLRQYTVQEMAGKMKLLEGEVMEILEDILEQLREAGLLASLQTGVSLETFQERERRSHETISGYTPMEISNTVDGSDVPEPLENVPQPGSDISNGLLIEALRNGVERAISLLPSQDRRLLALKFDTEWTLQEIAGQGEGLGLGQATEKRVGHAIDSILRSMLPIINRALVGVEEMELRLPGLKKILLEWGTQ